MVWNMFYATPLTIDKVRFKIVLDTLCSMFDKFYAICYATHFYM